MTDNGMCDAQGNFVGWIPTLSGELIFTHSSPGLSEYDYYNINTYKKCEDFYPHDYLILSSSVVNWKDSGLVSENGLFRIFVNLESCPNQAKGLPAKRLKGEISIITEPGGLLFKRSESEIGLLKTLNLIEADIEKLRKDTTAVLDNDRVWESVKEKVPRINQHLQELSNDKEIFTINVVLESEGIVYLTLVDANGDAIGDYGLCRQAYYYLKYLFHKHTHHDYSSESLTTIHKFDKTNAASAAKNLISDLKAGLVDTKRSSKARFGQAAGIASYAKSLLLSCHRLGFYEAMDEKDAQQYVQQELKYFEHVTESLQVLQVSHRRAYLRLLFGHLYKIVGFAFLFLSPLMLITVRSPEFQKSQQNITASSESFAIHFFQKIKDYFFDFASWNFEIITISYVVLIVLGLFAAFLFELSPVSRERNVFGSFFRRNARTIFSSTNLNIFLPLSYIRWIGIWIGNYLGRGWSAALRVKSRIREEKTVLGVLSYLFVKVRYLLLGVMLAIGGFLIYRGVLILIGSNLDI